MYQEAFVAARGGGGCGKAGRPIVVLIVAGEGEGVQEVRRIQDRSDRLLQAPYTQACPLLSFQQHNVHAPICRGFWSGIYCREQVGTFKCRCSCCRSSSASCDPRYAAAIAPSTLCMET